MRYRDGLEVRLGDTVRVPVPDGERVARVVMLGDSREQLALEASFLSWVEEGDVLQKHSVVVEWLGENPFAHQSPEYSPVGAYMFSTIDEFVSLVCRNAT
jgi:hypothetical protein